MDHGDQVRGPAADVDKCVDRGEPTASPVREKHRRVGGKFASKDPDNVGLGMTLTTSTQKGKEIG